MKNYNSDIIRQTELLAKILNGDEISKADAADIFNVTEVTINRDLRVLRNNGIGIYSKKNKIVLEQQVQTKELVQLASTYLPLKLNSDVFYRKVKAYSKTDKHHFFTKLVLLSKSVDESLVLQIRYKRFYDNKSIMYKLLPVRLYSAGFNWIVQGYKPGESILKSFYLSRIEQVKLPGEKFNKLALPKSDEKLYDVELRFDSRVEDEIVYKIWFESFDIERSGEHTILKTRMPITNTLAGWCISWWDTIEIIKPVELKEYINEMIKEYQSKNR